MTNFQRITVLLAVLAILSVVGVSEAKADPVQFGSVQALQNGGSTSIDLFANPGVTLFGPQLSFLIPITGTLPPGVTNILQVTYTEAGSAPIVQNFLIPAFGIVPPPYSQLVTFTSPGASFQGVAATLTVDILEISPDFVIPTSGLGRDSFTFEFTVVQPVPEPATMILLGTGVLGLLQVRKRRKVSETTSSAKDV